MRPWSLVALALVAATPLAAQQQRAMAAHEHGVSTLEIAIEGGALVLDLLSPGADIVGFEHVAHDETDKDAVAAAIGQFLRPETILSLPEAAGCRLTAVRVHLHAGAHSHERAHHDPDHEGHDHDDDHSDDHGDGHSEFHATYGFECDAPQALTTLGLPFFAHFPNAQEIEVRYVTDTGAGLAEITRDRPELRLE